MKSKILIPLTVALLLNGCGKESPKEVTKSFVGAINDADFEEAYKYVDNKGLLALDSLAIYCKQDDLRKYYKEVKKAFFVLNLMPVKFHETTKAYLNKLKKSDIDLEKLNDDKTYLKDRMKIFKKMFSIAKESYSPLFEKYKKKNKVYTIKNEEVIDMMIFYIMANDGYSRQDSPRDLLYSIMYYLDMKGKLSLNKQCVKKYTYFGDIDDIKYKFKRDDLDEKIINVKIKTKEDDTKLEILDNKDKNIIVDWKLRNEPRLYRLIR